MFNLLKSARLRKAVSVITAACFTFSIFASNVFAAPAPVQPAASVVAVPSLDYVVPFNIGRITDSLKAGSGRVLVNIQDLHAHEETQRNISSILALLDAKYGINKIYVEGAAGKFSTDWIANISDQDFKNTVINSLMKEGKLTGAEYYSIQSEKTDILQGIENKKLYIENFERLNEIYKKRDEIQKLTPEIKLFLNEISEQYYSKNNKKLLRAVNKYQAGEVQADKYFRYLLSKASESGVSFSNYGTVVNFARIISIQSSLNSKKINSQIMEFADSLKSDIPYSEFKKISDMFGKPEQEGNLYLTLADAYYKYNYAGKYGELEKFFNFMRLNQSINPVDLVMEEKQLTKEIMYRFAQTESEKEIIFLNDMFNSFINYLDNKVSAREYDFMEKNMPEFKNLWKKYVDATGLPEISSYYSLFDQFYKVNIERNRYFLKEITGVLPKQAEKKVRLINNAKQQLPSELLAGSKNIDVVITGGFHTHDLARLMGDNGYSYVVITPNVTQNTVLSEANYETNILQQAEILNNTFKDMIMSAMLGIAGTSDAALKAAIAKYTPYTILEEAENTIGLNAFMGTVIPEMISGDTAQLNGQGIYDLAANVTKEGDAYKVSFSYKNAQGQTQPSVERTIARDSGKLDFNTREQSRFNIAAAGITAGISIAAGILLAPVAIPVAVAVSTAVGITGLLFNIAGIANAKMVSKALDDFGNYVISKSENPYSAPEEQTGSMPDLLLPNGMSQQEFLDEFTAKLRPVQEGDEDVNIKLAPGIQIRSMFNPSAPKDVTSKLFSTIATVSSSEPDVIYVNPIALFFLDKRFPALAEDLISKHEQLHTRIGGAKGEIRASIESTYNFKSARHVLSAYKRAATEKQARAKLRRLASLIQAFENTLVDVEISRDGGARGIINFDQSISHFYSNASEMIKLIDDYPYLVAEEIGRIDNVLGTISMLIDWSGRLRGENPYAAEGTDKRVFDAMTAQLSKMRMGVLAQLFSTFPGKYVQVMQNSGVNFEDVLFVYNLPAVVKEKPNAGANAVEVEVAKEYSDGKIQTTPITEPIRATTKDDVTYIRDMSKEEQRALLMKGLEIMLGGKVYISMLAAGASSRMNTKEAPQEVKDMVTGEEIRSKAAVPIGMLPDGRVITYEDAFFGNIAELVRQINAAARKAGVEGDAGDNTFGYVTNETYKEEQRRILEKNDHYGLNPQNIRPFLQPLGAKFIGSVEEVRKSKPAAMTTFANDEERQKYEDEMAKYYMKLAYAANARAKVLAGDASAAIFYGERDPWGHGEYFHQMIISGELLSMFENGIEYCFVKNVDNYASKFDMPWLMLLGLFAKRTEADDTVAFQSEVSARSPGLKGGSWVVKLEDGSQMAAEDPTLDATRKAGLTNIKPTESFAFNNAVAFFLPKYVASLYMTEGQSLEEFKAELKAAQGDQAKLEEIAQRGRAKFPKLIDGKPAKSKVSFTIDENVLASAGELLSAEEYAEINAMMGRSDEIAPVVVKVETNMWQSTGVTGLKVTTAGVDGGRNIDILNYASMSDEQKKEVLQWLRFVATKAWDKSESDKAKVVSDLNAALELKEGDPRYITSAEDLRVLIGLETYEGNKIIADDLLKYIFGGELVPEDIMIEDAGVEAINDTQELIVSRKAAFDMTADRILETGMNNTARDLERKISELEYIGGEIASLNKQIGRKDASAEERRATIARLNELLDVVEMNEIKTSLPVGASARSIMKRLDQYNLRLESLLRRGKADTEAYRRTLRSVTELSSMINEQMEADMGRARALMSEDKINTAALKEIYDRMSEANRLMLSHGFQDQRNADYLRQIINVLSADYRDLIFTDSIIDGIEVDMARARVLMSEDEIDATELKKIYDRMSEANRFLLASGIQDRQTEAYLHKIANALGNVSLTSDSTKREYIRRLTRVLGEIRAVKFANSKIGTKILVTAFSPLFERARLMEMFYGFGRADAVQDDLTRDRMRNDVLETRNRFLDDHSIYANARKDFSESIDEADFEKMHRASVIMNAYYIGFERIMRASGKAYTHILGITGSERLARIAANIANVISHKMWNFRAKATPMTTDVDPSPVELAVAQEYSRGDITTTPIPGKIRATKKEDVTYIRDMSPERQRELLIKGIDIMLGGGKVYISMLAAGASSRMNTGEAPQEVRDMVGGAEIGSKAAVPIGRLDDGRVVRYEDAYFANIARLIEQINAEAKKAGRKGDAGDNFFAYLTNGQYADEQRGILEENDHYGLNPDNIRSFRQPLGAKFVGTVAEVRKSKPAEMTTFANDEERQKYEEEMAKYYMKLAYAANARARVLAGDESAAIFYGERDPWGHGEYFHQMIVSGELLFMIENGIEFCFAKNVDNYASKFDMQWLMLLGLFSERVAEGAAFQAEVSHRSPGIKGGSWMVNEANNSQMSVEDPTIAATAAAAQAVAEGRMEGEYSNIGPMDSYAFNNGVAFYIPRYVASLYMMPGQSYEDFQAELKAARDDKEKLEEIAQRGRAKFPKLIDGKPSKKPVKFTLDESVMANAGGLLTAAEMEALSAMSGTSMEISPVVVKVETNMWQSTGVTDMIVTTAGVDGGRNIDIQNYVNLSPADKVEVLKWLRFLATKSWDKSTADKAKAVKDLNAALGLKEGDAGYITSPEDLRVKIGLESFEGNKVLADDLLRYIFEGELVPADILVEQKAKEEKENLLIRQLNILANALKKAFKRIFLGKSYVEIKAPELKGKSYTFVADQYSPDIMRRARILASKGIKVNIVMPFDRRQGLPEGVSAVRQDMDYVYSGDRRASVLKYSETDQNTGMDINLFMFNQIDFDGKEITGDGITVDMAFAFNTLEWLKDRAVRGGNYDFGIIDVQRGTDISFDMAQNMFPDAIIAKSIARASSTLDEMVLRDQEKGLMPYFEGREEAFLADAGSMLKNRSKNSYMKKDDISSSTVDLSLIPLKELDSDAEIQAMRANFIDVAVLKLDASNAVADVNVLKSVLLRVHKHGLKIVLEYSFSSNSDIDEWLKTLKAELASFRADNGIIDGSKEFIDGIRLDLSRMSEADAAAASSRFAAVRSIINGESSDALFGVKSSYYNEAVYKAADVKPVRIVSHSNQEGLDAADNSWVDFSVGNERYNQQSMDYQLTAQDIERIVNAKTTSIVGIDWYVIKSLQKAEDRTFSTAEMLRSIFMKRASIFRSSPQGTFNAARALASRQNVQVTAAAETAYYQALSDLRKAVKAADKKEAFDTAAIAAAVKSLDAQSTALSDLASRLERAASDEDKLVLLRNIEGYIQGALENTELTAFERIKGKKINFVVNTNKDLLAKALVNAKLALVQANVAAKMAMADVNANAPYEKELGQVAAGAEIKNAQLDKAVKLVQSLDTVRAVDAFAVIQEAINILSALTESDELADSKERAVALAELLTLLALKSDYMPEKITDAAKEGMQNIAANTRAVLAAA